MTLFQQIAAAVNWWMRVNENFDSVSPAGLYGRNPETTTGLTWGYLGGNFNGVAVSNGTVSITASNTNYVVAHRTTGVVTVATTTTNWLNTTTYLQLYQIVAGTSTVTSYDDKRQAFGISSGGGGGGSVDSVNGRTGDVLVPTCIPIACSDETTALTTGAAKVTFRMPYAMTDVSVRASLTTAQASGSTFTVDINEGGTSILSTKLTIDNSEKSSVTASAPPVVSDTSLADDAEITIDIDQIGDGTAKGLKVYLIGTV